MNEIGKKIDSHTSIISKHTTAIALQTSAFEGHLSLVALLKTSQDKKTVLEQKVAHLTAELQEARNRTNEEREMKPEFASAEEVAELRTENEEMRIELDGYKHNFELIKNSLARWRASDGPGS